MNKRILIMIIIRIMIMIIITLSMLFLMTPTTSWTWAWADSIWFGFEAAISEYDEHDDFDDGDDVDDGGGDYDNDLKMGFCDDLSLGRPHLVRIWSCHLCRMVIIIMVMVQTMMVMVVMVVMMVMTMTMIWMPAFMMTWAWADSIWFGFDVPSLIRMIWSSWFWWWC